MSFSLAENRSTTVHVTKNMPTHIDLFYGTSSNVVYMLDTDVQRHYLAICMGGQVDIICETTGKNVSVKMTVLCVGSEKVQHIRVRGRLGVDLSHVSITIIGLLGDGADISVDGGVDIAPDIQNVEGYLQEEMLILGNRTRLYTLPQLDVASSTVKASHGAKVHRIDPHKLFYMQAKGLSYERAKRMVVEGYVENAFHDFDSEDVQIQQIKNKIWNMIHF